MRLFLPSCFLAAALAAAAAAAQAPARPLAGAYRIAGRMVNSATGEPVRRATVTALADDQNHVVATTISDAEGRFSLDRLPAGKYPLTASKRGFRTAYYDEHDEFNSAIVTGPGQDTENLLFKLTPASVLTGTITDDGGDPVQNATVMLFKRPAPDRPSQRLQQLESVSTDDSGAYEFSELAEGEYFLVVKADPWYAMNNAANSGAQPSPLDVAYPITYYDSTTDESSATAIPLAAGARETADMTLHAVPALRIRIAVPRRQGGQPASALRPIVFGMQVSGTSPPMETQPGTQNLEFRGVAPGHYELSQGDPPRVVALDPTASGDIDPNAGTPTVAVTGSLRTSSGAPMTAEASLTLECVDEEHSQPPQQTNARKGEFKFDAIPPGTWALTVSNLSEDGQLLPILNVATGGTVTPGNQFTVKDHPLAVTVTVSRSETRIEGFARLNDKPAAGVMIVLIPAEKTAYRSLIRRDQSDSDGSFALRDVPPGKYTVVAIEDDWKLDWLHYETMERFLPGGLSVTVGEHAGSAVQLPQPIPAQTR